MTQFDRSIFFCHCPQYDEGTKCLCTLTPCVPFYRRRNQVQPNCKTHRRYLGESTTPRSS